MSTAPRRLGKYELLQQLGRGNVGDVWKARDVALHRIVALKILHSDLQADPHFLSRFSDEGQLLVSLHHPHLAEVYETGIHRTAESHETIAYIASEYIDGYTLTDYLQATSHRGIFPAITDITYIFTSIGAAIDYAHQNGVLHGNIKPANILLNRENRNHFIAGEPVLSDVGIASIVGDANHISSPQYISPEQAAGDPMSGSSDIYALGVILYELCTGVVPFRDESSVAVMMQHINTLPTPPVLINPNIPPALSEVILRAMAKDPATRFSRASQFAAAIVDAGSMAPRRMLALPGLTKEESSAQRSPYQSGNVQSILGVPQPPEYTPGYFSRPLPGLTQRNKPLPTTMQSFKPSETISEPLPPLPPTLAEPSIEKKEAASTPSEPLVMPEIPSPAANSRISAKLKAVPRPGLTTNTATRLTTPLASTRIQQSSAAPSLPLSPHPQETQVQSAIRSLQPQPATAERARSLPQPYIPAPLASPPRSSASTPGFFSDSPLYIVVISLVLLLLLVGGAIGANLFLNKGTQASIPGRVFFQDDALGHNDQLRIELSNIASPPTGSNYVAWLQDTHNQASYLGVLPAHDGKMSYLYTGNARHDNLLSFIQGIIITTENAESTPKNPSDHVVYQARFSTALLQSLKNLLYSTPGLPPNQAVAATMFEDIKSINDKAVSVVDSIQNTHDTGLAIRQATRIIELIDGSAYAASSGDQPRSIPKLLDVGIGMLSSPGQIGYIDLLDKQLDELKAQAGNDNELLQHINNVKGAVTDLRDWVQKMRTHDVQILKAANLADPTITAIALQLKQEAADSYTGRTIPPDSSPRPILGSAGAYQAYTETQYMATLNFSAA